MKKKLSLEDLKVQSFVTALTDDEAKQVVGGDTRSWHSYCCDTDPSTVTSDYTCGCTSPTTICNNCATDVTSMCPDTSIACCYSAHTSICPDTSIYCC